MPLWGPDPAEQIFSFCKHQVFIFTVLGRAQEVLTDLNSSPELVRIQLCIIMGLDRAGLQAGVSLQFAAAPAAGGDRGEARQSRGGRLRSSQLEAGGRPGEEAAVSGA